MQTVNVFDAKNRLSALINQVEGGTSVTITRRGAPVARLMPVAANERGRMAASRLRALREAIASRGGSFSWDEQKALRDEGRR